MGPTVRLRLRPRPWLSAAQSAGDPASLGHRCPGPGRGQQPEPGAPRTGGHSDVYPQHRRGYSVGQPGAVISGRLRPGSSGLGSRTAPMGAPRGPGQGTATLTSLQKAGEAKTTPLA